MSSFVVSKTRSRHDSPVQVHTTEYEAASNPDPHITHKIYTTSRILSSQDQQSTMQLTTLLTALSATSAALTAPPHGTISSRMSANEQACLNKHSGAHAGITAFCSKANIDTGSAYAKTGTTANGPAGSQFAGEDDTTHAYVIGSCPSDQTWIPQDWCLLQFFETCAKGDSQGHAYRKFGYKDCQEFNLEADV